MFRRRRFPFRRRSRFSKRGFRPFAARVRPKYDKVVLFSTLQGDFTEGAILSSAGGGLVAPCGPVVLTHCNADGTTCHECATPPCPDGPPVCCNQLLTARLITNSTLETFFQDRVTIVRLYGDVWCKSLAPVDGLGIPQLCSANSGLPTASQYVARYAEQWSLGLRKFNTTEYPWDREANFGNPPSETNDFSTQLYNYDWTEPRWLWQRHSYWQPSWRVQEQFLLPGSIVGCCSTTSGGALNTIAEGSGTIDTRITSSGCGACNTSEGCPQEYKVIDVPTPPTHHYRLNVKRHIALRGDDNLDLQIGVRHPSTYSNVTGWGCDSTLTNERSTNYQIHIRIGAVLRLN